MRSSFIVHDLCVRVEKVFEATRKAEKATAAVTKTNGMSRRAERGEDESGEGREVTLRRRASVDETT